MNDESLSPERTINVVVAGTPAEVEGLARTIQDKVGEAVQTWQERQLQRAVSAASARER